MPQSLNGYNVNLYTYWYETIFLLSTVIPDFYQKEGKNLVYINESKVHEINPFTRRNYGIFL